MSKTKYVKEDMGGVSAPMTTLVNTPGMGTATPPPTADGNSIGSGDKWGNTIGGKPYTQGGKVKTKKKKPIKKKKKSEKIEEENINPYDKIGTSMAKKMGVKTPFKKKKSSKNQNKMVQRTFEHEIIPLDEFLNEDFRQKEVVFTHKNNPRYTFSLIKDGQGRILEIIDLPPRIRFPFNVGQIYNRSIETWACNNEFLIDGKDPCPEKKIFGVKASDVPPGHEWRRIFPNKFR